MSTPVREHNIADFQGQKNVFWSAGNKPTQLLNGIDNVDLALHLKSLLIRTHTNFTHAICIREIRIPK